jgi:hypothetical protein
MSNLNPISSQHSSRSAWARRVFAAGALGVALAGGGFAHAADVYWSVGVHQPGVSVGVSNAPPVVVAYPSYPVVVPRVIYGPPPAVVIAPQPRVIGWVPPGHRKHWKKHHRHYRDDDDDDRWERRGYDRWDDDDDRRGRRDGWGY